MAYPTVALLCLGGAACALMLAVAAWYCFKRGRARSAKRHGVDQPLAFHMHRRPTAVKSPAGNGGPAGATGTHYLKKSPSPTGAAKTPPGVSIEYLDRNIQKIV